MPERNRTRLALEELLIFLLIIVLIKQCWVAHGVYFRLSFIDPAAQIPVPLSYNPTGAEIIVPCSYHSSTWWLSNLWLLKPPDETDYVSRRKGGIKWDMEWNGMETERNRTEWNKNTCSAFQLAYSKVCMRFRSLIWTQLSFSTLEITGSFSHTHHMNTFRNRIIGRPPGLEDIRRTGCF